MRILHLGKYFSPYVGGVEQVESDCVRAIGGAAEQLVFCFNHERGDLKETVNGVTVVRADVCAKAASQPLSASYGRLLKRAFREFDPDAVIFHFPNPFGAHYLLRQLKERPACRLIVWWHLDITKQKFLGKVFRGQTERLLKRADTVVSTSPNYIEGSKFLTRYREKCVVIPNCAGDERIRTDGNTVKRAEEIRAKYAGKTLLFALGRHVPYKGMEYLIRASARLGDSFRVLIGGEGPLTDSLKSLAKGDEKIVFLGRIDEETRKACTLACDIFCFPSITKNEAFGIALAEAMALGKPAVTFHIEGSGVNYVSVDRETGLEAENANPEKYAAAIETLAQNESLRKQYGENARKRALTLFSEAAFRENVRTLLRIEV